MKLATMPRIEVGGHQVPTAQSMPPAGHDDIAFRPACSQLQEIGLANGLTAWAISLPDGDTRVLAEYDPMSRTSAHAFLDASGLCKVGGEQVPIVWASQLPQRATAAPATATVVPQSEGISPESSPWWHLSPPMIVGVAVLLGAAAYAACRLWGWRLPMPDFGQEPGSLPPEAPPEAPPETSANQAFLQSILLKEPAE